MRTWCWCRTIFKISITSIKNEEESWDRLKARAATHQADKDSTFRLSNQIRDRIGLWTLRVSRGSSTHKGKTMAFSPTAVKTRIENSTTSFILILPREQLKWWGSSTSRLLLWGWIRRSKTNSKLTSWVQNFKCTNPKELTFQIKMRWAFWLKRKCTHPILNSEAIHKNEQMAPQSQQRS